VIRPVSGFCGTAPPPISSQRSRNNRRTYCTNSVASLQSRSNVFGVTRRECHHCPSFHPFLPSFE
jgi:hypothetical protein